MKKQPTKQKRISYRTATGNALLHAYAKAAKVFTSDPAVCSTEQDAGFIILPKERGETPKGFQVFVKMCRYDEALLHRDPVSGGLLANERRPRPTQRKTLARDEPGFAGAPIGGDTKDLHGQSGGGWIGVDLDGTLACYDGWKGPQHIGKPIAKMVDRVIGWILNGPEVRIMTARVAPGNGDADVRREAIEQWLKKHVYSRLPASFVDAPVPFPYLKITHEKDHRMIELWDDRCVQVIPNTGERADGKE